MIKRTIVVNSPHYISTRNEQLVLSRRGEDTSIMLPLEDIGVLELDSLQCTVSTMVLARLAEHGVTVIVTDQTHHPVGMLLPLQGNTLHGERIRLQVEVSRPTEKRIWQHTIKSKIENQAYLLMELGFNHASVLDKSRRVMSNDSSNREAVAAALYWKQILRPFGCGRDPDGPFPNNYLNYGYAVLRACVARALVTSGLHPAIGIKHSNKYNAFALADDVMEPYRPFVDRIVFNVASANPSTLDITPEIKRQLLSVLVHDTYWNDGRKPLMNGVSRSSATLVQALSGAKPLPEFPSICE